MKYFLKLGFILLIITSIASGILAYINSVTSPMIEENQKKVQEEARAEVLMKQILDAIEFVPDTLGLGKTDEQSRQKVLLEVINEAIKNELIAFIPDSIAVEKDEERDPLKKVSINNNSFFHFYKCFHNKDNLIGYTFQASLYGYSSDVKTMVGVSPDFIIKKIKIISQSETPGLGANCMKEDIQRRFFDLNKEQLVVKEDGGNIKSITGATITTRTIANSLKNGLSILQNNLEEKELSNPGNEARKEVDR